MRSRNFTAALSPYDLTRPGGHEGRKEKNMIETYGIKIDLESLESVCRAAGGYPQNSSCATAIYYNETTDKVWSTEFVDYQNDGIEGEYPIAYCQDGRISPQYVMDKIKERLDYRKEAELL